MLLGSMNRQMNLPALQRITMEFERENEIMDERQEMMDDAIDEATGMEDDEAEGEDIVKEILDEIGVDLTQMVRLTRGLDVVPTTNSFTTSWARHRQARSRKSQQLELGLLRLLAGVVGGEALTLVMMTSKLAWTASEDDEYRSIFCLFVLPRACPFTRFSTGLFLGVSLIPSDDICCCSERIIQFSSFFAACLNDVRF